MHTLETALNANLTLPPEFRGELTNHLPMALHSLHSMGASPARLQAFYQGYARRFQGAVSPALAAPVPDWRTLRGEPNTDPQADRAFDSHTYAALLATFQGLLARHGHEVVLAQTLPELVGGVAAAAFHGVIRTAHAVESGHTGELAAALAYWAWRWQPLAAPTIPAQPLLPFGQWTTQLVALAPTWRSEGSLIAIRMEEATHSPVYQQLASALEPATDVSGRLQAFARFALERYTVSGNFTVLHMVTGLRALRVLSPWWAGTQGAQTRLTHAITAAYLAGRVTPKAVWPSQPVMSWASVIAAAIASDDDHVIKLVHACQQEAAMALDDVADRYLVAATRAVRT